MTFARPDYVAPEPVKEIPVSAQLTVQGTNVGKDAYLFVECYIKSEVDEKYYWVDDDGVWLDQYDTLAPDPGYRVVYNYKTENAYQR